MIRIAWSTATAASHSACWASCSDSCGDVGGRLDMVDVGHLELLDQPLLGRAR
jgi:hypothetical protein